jgi:hypothetical protein
MAEAGHAGELADRYAALLGRERELVAARARVAELDERFRRAATGERALGASTRTAQRRVGVMMAEAGARTRFQAGVQAALRRRS